MSLLRELKDALFGGNPSTERTRTLSGGETLYTRQRGDHRGSVWAVVKNGHVTDSGRDETESYGGVTKHHAVNTQTGKTNGFLGSQYGEWKSTPADPGWSSSPLGNSTKRHQPRGSSWLTPTNYDD